MNVEKTPITANFGAMIACSDPLSCCDKKSASQLKQLLYENKFLLFKNQELSNEQYIQFAKQLGEPIIFSHPSYRHPDHPEIFVSSNMYRQGKKIGVDRVGLNWHSDCCFLPNPLPLTMLYCKYAPEQGGETEFTDMHYVYKQLPKKIKESIDKKLVSFRAEKQYIITAQDVGMYLKELIDKINRDYAPAKHQSVFKHRFTGKKILYINNGFSENIIGLKPKKSQRLLNEIFRITEQAKARYKHQWNVGDVLIWDNRSVIHRAYPASSGQQRMMYRIGIKDDVFF